MIIENSYNDYNGYCVCCLRSQKIMQTPIFRSYSLISLIIFVKTTQKFLDDSWYIGMARQTHDANHGIQQVKSFKANQHVLELKQYVWRHLS